MAPAAVLKIEKNRQICIEIGRTVAEISIVIKLFFFRMADVRHLGFLKFETFNGRGG